MLESLIRDLAGSGIVSLLTTLEDVCYPDHLLS